MNRITKNELIAINAKLAQENAELRAQLSATKVQRVASQGVASGTRRPLASFWKLIDAGQYIVDLKNRGCKVALKAQRDERGHFVVVAG